MSRMVYRLRFASNRMLYDVNYEINRKYGNKVDGSVLLLKSKTMLVDGVEITYIFHVLLMRSLRDNHYLNQGNAYTMVVYLNQEHYHDTSCCLFMYMYD